MGLPAPRITALEPLGFSPGSLIIEVIWNTAPWMGTQFRAELDESESRSFDSPSLCEGLLRMTDSGRFQLLWIWALGLWPEAGVKRVASLLPMGEPRPVQGSGPGAAL